MSDVTCDVNDFYENVMHMFEATVTEAEEDLRRDIYAAADDAVAELREASGKFSKGDEPKKWRKAHPDRPEHLYEKGWVAYKHKMVDGHVEAVVANKNAPGLTHLIEKGHEKFVYGHDTGERTKARPHIKQAYEHSAHKHFGGY